MTELAGGEDAVVQSEGGEGWSAEVVAVVLELGTGGENCEGDAELSQKLI